MRTSARHRLIWSRDTALSRPVPMRGPMLAQADIIDIRTRRPWRRPQAPTWPFLVDMLCTFAVVMIGAWLFNKMRGG